MVTSQFGVGITSTGIGADDGRRNNGEEVYGAYCWWQWQEAAGADRTAPAGREFDSVSPCAASCRVVHLSLPLLLSSPFHFIPLFAMPHLTVLALSSFLVLPCFFFCTHLIPSSSLLLERLLLHKRLKHRRLDFESTTRSGS